MNKIEKIVKEYSKKYICGNKYFNAVDNYIKYNNEILQEILDMIPDHNTLVLSGNFGYQMIQYIKETKQRHEYILIVGSPRKMQDTRIAELNFNPNYGTAIFVDDSFFSGGTFFYCKGYIEAKFNITVGGCIVAYDGSYHKKDYVKSLYRYFDHYDKNGIKKETRIEYDIAIKSFWNIIDTYYNEEKNDNEFDIDCMNVQKYIKQRAK